MRKATPPREKTDSAPHRGTRTLILSPMFTLDPREVDPARLFADDEPLLVYEPKGEVARLALSLCAKMGKPLLVFDPYHLATDEPATLNPLDTLGAQTLQDDACRLARCLCEEGPPEHLLGALIVHVLTSERPESRNFGHVCDLLAVADFIAWAQTLLHAHPALHPFARQQLEAFLAHDPQTKRSVLAAVRDPMRIFEGEEVRRDVAATNFDYEKLKSGPPPTFYFVTPPARMKNLGSLPRLWSSCLPDWEPPV